LGRAEAQAELLMSIIHSLESLDIPEDQKSQAVSNLFLIRTAQVLESMSTVYGTEGNLPGDGNG
jgi:hypothetical protein